MNSNEKTARIAGALYLFAGLHESGVFIAQIFWGLWLFPLGYLVYKSDFLPGVLGILLMVGCVGYLVHSLQTFLVPDNAAIEAASSALLLVSFVAEMSFAFWLLIKGVNIRRAAA